MVRRGRGELLYQIVINLLNPRRRDVDDAMMLRKYYIFLKILKMIY
jgi:hypothetical protein